MQFVIIIPAYNEEDFIVTCLESILSQSLLPNEVIVVNDNSTDKTLNILKEYQLKNPVIKIVSTDAKAVHMPGSKVIQTFYKGYESVSIDYDVIFKLDADLIFPSNYFEEIIKIYKSNAKAGMVGGVATILIDEEWKVENLTNLDHIRGALKSYHKDCFKKIGGLKKELGWDTVDEYLARFYGCEIIVKPYLKVKHLRPTGNIYSKDVAAKQGKAFYKMRYGFLLSFLASVKMAFKKKSFLLLVGYLKGYANASLQKESTFVSKQQAKFIRKYRWNKIFNKYF